MTQRTRIFVGILLIYVVGVGVLMWRLLADIDPRYRESAEESLVETAHLMASLIEQTSTPETIDVHALTPLFRDLYARQIDADIFGIKKTRIELRATVVDAQGIVLFDSLGRHDGKDFSQWRDVRLALAGEYGARTSQDIDGDANTSVMVVARAAACLGASSARSRGQAGAGIGQFIGPRGEDLDGGRHLGRRGAVAGGDRQRLAGAPARPGDRLRATSGASAAWICRASGAARWASWVPRTRRCATRWRAATTWPTTCRR
jgi:two-component system sensor histidine kinase CreC